MAEDDRWDDERWTVDATGRGEFAVLVRRFLVTVVEGPEQGVRFTSTTDRCAVGSHPSNDVVLSDATVSRFHCEIVIEDDGPHVRDLGSLNGTELNGVRVVDAWARDESTVGVGRSALRFELEAPRNRLEVSFRSSFGGLIGESAKMRAVYALLERLAPSEVTVLIEGETGSGKEEAAAAIHAESGRCEGPFTIVDCTTIPRDLFESSLFGHEAGAFSGATTARAGAFESATGGTVLLDEIGELPLDLQPKLLRAIEEREVRRVGGTRSIPFDARILAATRRDLRREVTAGRFREDLYYRLAVVRVGLPPLRAHVEDIPALISHFADELQLDEASRARLMQPDRLAELAFRRWPGNVRQLRNHLLRESVLGETDDAVEPTAEASSEAIDPTLPYAEARRRSIERFESKYAAALVATHGGNVSKAARAAGMGRSYLHRVLRRHRVER